MVIGEADQQVPKIYSNIADSLSNFGHGTQLAKLLITVVQSCFVHENSSCWASQKI